MSIRPAPASRAAPPVQGIVLALAALVAPPLAVFAPLGLAPLVALTAAALLAAGGRKLLERLRGNGVLLLLFLLLSAWAALSALWSPIPAHSFFEALRLLAILFAGLVVTEGAALIDDVAARRVGQALLAGIALAILLLQVELRSGEWIAHLLGGLPLNDPLSASRYDRGITVLLLFACAAAGPLALSRQWLALAVLVVATGITIFAFNSHASMLGFAAALGVFALAWRLPRLAALCLIAALLFPALAFPPLAPRGPDIARIERSAPELPSSAIHRLAIWRFVGDRIADRPLLGWGMDAARAIPGGKTPVHRLFPEIEIAPTAEALPLHPHDASLQWRLELGLPGLLLVLLAVGRLLWALAVSPMPVWRRSLAFAYAGAAASVALLSFGAWQAWWLSTLWLGAALTLRLGETQDGWNFRRSHP